MSYTSSFDYNDYKLQEQNLDGFEDLINQQNGYDQDFDSYEYEKKCQSQECLISQKQVNYIQSDQNMFIQNYLQNQNLHYDKIQEWQNREKMLDKTEIITYKQSLKKLKQMLEFVLKNFKFTKPNLKKIITNLQNIKSINNENDLQDIQQIIFKDKKSKTQLFQIITELMLWSLYNNEQI